MNKRRRYSGEFRLVAIRLVKDQGYSRAEAARNLGIDSGMLGRWIVAQELRDSAKSQIELSIPLQEEVKRLREENRKLKMEREILVKAAAFFAKESS